MQTTQIIFIGHTIDFTVDFVSNVYISDVCFSPFQTKYEKNGIILLEKAES